MPKFQLNGLLTRIKNFYAGKIRPLLSRLPDFFLNFISSWWHVLLIGLAAVIFLYYPLGGLLINNIDKNTSYEINNNKPEQSCTVDMMAFIINREVNEKLWTPNLPFFFPSYFLDNMPAFQLGMISSVSDISRSFAARVEKSISEGNRLHLKKAAELLKYPGTVWLFSPGDKLLPAPSANTQYRKARKQLIKYNRELAAEKEIFYKSPSDLAYILAKSSRSLWNSAGKLEAHIRENSSSWTDFQADDVFYYHQGRAYAYFLLYKALGCDYKDVIVDAEQYQNWTALLKALENAALIDPFIIRNGELSSSSAPNHLSYLQSYLLKAQSLMQKIAQNLDTKQQPKDIVHAD